MAVFIISVVVIALVIAGMAIGVIAGRKPIKGSCGGLGQLGLASSCEICGGDPQRCDTRSADTKTQAGKPQTSPTVDR